MTTTTPQPAEFRLVTEAGLEARLAGLGTGGGGSGPEAMVWRGVYETGVEYATGDVVTDQGALWVARNPTTSPPVDDAVPEYVQTFADLAVPAELTLSDPAYVTLTSDLTSGGLGTPPTGVTQAMQVKSATRSTHSAAITLTFLRDGTLTFWEAANGERSNTTTYDYGDLLVDGARHGDTVPPVGDSNVTTWQERVVPVTAGTHTFTWQYRKDGTGDHGRDAYLVTRITTDGVGTDVDWDKLEHTHHPADLGTGTPDSNTFLRGDGTWAVPSAGESGAADGAMVWAGAFDPGVTYPKGSVVQSGGALFVAMADGVTGTTPSPVQPTFVDDFTGRAAIGPLWDIADAPWGIVAGRAEITSTTNGKRLIKRLTPDGEMTLTGYAREFGNQDTRVVFGYVDEQNHYYWAPGGGTIRKVVNGSATTIGDTIVDSQVYDTAEPVTISKHGGTITVTHRVGGTPPGTFTTTVTDPTPLAGTGWGLWHGTYLSATSGDLTRLDKFEFTPYLDERWQVLEQRWTLTGILDVDASTATTGQGLIYNDVTKKWTNTTPPLAVTAHGATASTPRPPASVVRWYGTVEPANATTRDEWVHEPDMTLKRKKADGAWGAAGAAGVTSPTVLSMVQLSQAEYDALTPDPATLYLITGA